MLDILFLVGYLLDLYSLHSLAIAPKMCHAVDRVLTAGQCVSGGFMTQAPHTMRLAKRECWGPLIGRVWSGMAVVSREGVLGCSSRPFGLEADGRADTSVWKDAKPYHETATISTSIPFIWAAKTRPNFRSPDRTPGQSSNFPESPHCRTKTRLRLMVWGEHCARAPTRFVVEDCAVSRPCLRYRSSGLTAMRCLLADPISYRSCRGQSCLYSTGCSALMHCTATQPSLYVRQTVSNQLPSSNVRFWVLRYVP
jgi:hypothetical protein